VNDSEKYVIFDLKNKFLGIIPHPKLISKAIKQARVKGGLSQPIEDIAHALTDEISAQDLNEFLRHTINSLLQIKQGIASAYSYQSLANALELLLANQLNLIYKLKSYMTNVEQERLESIKVSEAIDPYAILKMIQQRNLKDDEIKNYLCTQIDQNDLNDLVSNFLRAYKIVQHA